MYSEFFIVPWVKVRFKGYALYSSKVNNKMKHKISDHFQHCFGLNPNLGGFFKGSFWGGGGGEGGVKLPTPCLKLVRIMLETSNLARKYTLICSLRKDTFYYQGSLNFANVSIFCKKLTFLAKIVPLTFTQSNIVTAVLEIFSFCLQFL